MTTVDNQRVSSMTPSVPSLSAIHSTLSPLSKDTSSIYKEVSDFEQKQWQKEELVEHETSGAAKVKQQDPDQQLQSQQAQQLKIQQQREARRRKILDNAKSRLERLNGMHAAHPSFNAATSLDTKSSNGERKEEEVDSSSANHNLLQEEPCPDPEVQPDVPSYLNHYMNSNIDLTLQQRQAFGINNVIEAMLRTQLMNTAGFQSQQDAARWQTAEGVRAPTNLHDRKCGLFMIRYRLHMMVSALLSILVLVLWPPIPMESSSSSYVLLPAGLCVIIDLFFFREPINMNPLLETSLLMMGVGTRWLKLFYQFYSLVANIMIDLSVFLLTLVALSCILTLFSSERYNDLIRIP